MQTLFPTNCLLCLADCESDLCRACRESLPQLPSEHCPLCLLPTKDSCICGNCLKHPPVWTHALAALQYVFPIDAMIHSLKYQGNLAVAPILANLLLAKMNHCPLPDVIIPVPLHPTKLQERGFNQALEISRHISRQINVPLLPHACVRTKDTFSQTELSWKKRLTNMRNAFECTTSLAHKHVALLDDVMTSGATLNELAKVVCKQGATGVSVWVIARAMPSSALIKATEHHQTML